MITSKLEQVDTNTFAPVTSRFVEWLYAQNRGLPAGGTDTYQCCACHFRVDVEYGFNLVCKQGVMFVYYSLGFASAIP